MQGPLQGQTICARVLFNAFSFGPKGIFGLSETGQHLGYGVPDYRMDLTVEMPLENGEHVCILLFYQIPVFVQGRGVDFTFVTS